MNRFFGLFVVLVGLSSMAFALDLSTFGQSELKTVSTSYEAKRKSVSTAVLNLRAATASVNAKETPVAAVPEANPKTSGPTPDVKAKPELKKTVAKPVTTAKSNAKVVSKTKKK